MSEFEDINLRIPDAIIDIRYATVNNFTNKKLYDSPTAKLLPIVLDSLECAANKANESNLRIVIFDAYRPLEVQVELRKVFPVERYVRKNSNHCTGIAVDMTLATSEGQYLDMGTEYDDFTPMAHLSAPGLSDLQNKNRQLLNNIMVINGFTQNPYEWWHFDYLSAEVAVQA